MYLQTFESQPISQRWRRTVRDQKGYETTRNNSAPLFTTLFRNIGSTDIAPFFIQYLYNFISFVDKLNKRLLF